MVSEAKPITLENFVRQVIDDIKSATMADNGFVAGGIRFEVLVDKVEKVGQSVKVFVLIDKNDVPKREAHKVKFKIDFLPEGVDMKKSIGDILNELDRNQS